MTTALLNAQAPGIAPTVVATVNASGDSYCLSATQGGSTYHYIGGQDAGSMTGGGTVAPGACPTLT